ncbi:ATP-dependent DNA helicase DinG [Natribacillus halophilus]|uniref:3'-5' exonuclease DinG n=1 Tax=Natribacillus halophilus TaxID=549003 RepID=A0A1G8JA92_9BACI|nr:ATP-dependent DNA helicase DinG [Natribacillus halophilus]SDI28165.1 ATP-dependent DNA helicase DinG [Natribacillus halophilus]
MNRFVVVDVETTGNRPRHHDRVIEIGVAIVEDMQVTKTRSSLVQYEQEIPAFIARLTGITEKELSEAPTFEDLAPELLHDLDGAFLVAHNIDFDLQFLNNEFDRAGYGAFQGPVLDTVEMARMLLPTLADYRLPSLAEHFNISHAQAHRAGSDAEATARLMIRMMEKIQALPAITLEQLEPYTAYMREGLHFYVYETMKAKRQRHQKNDDDYDIYRGLALKKQKEQPPPPAREGISLTTEEFFGSDGALANASPSFEERTSQVEMAQKVGEVFAEEKYLLVEAATGTGKTLAYLFPAVAKSRKTRRPVVIATETIALQQQIKARDVPLLEKALDTVIEATVLKGRRHYLCLHKFKHFMEKQLPASYDEQLTAAQILVWLTDTETGDVEELNLPNGGYKLWEDLKSDPESCTQGNCSFFPHCFYPRAKANARGADMIITNHAQLFTDHFQDTRILPAYDYVIADEAHHLEEAAGRHLGTSSSYQHFMRLYNRFGVQESAGLFSNLEVFIETHADAFSTEWLRERKGELQSLQQEWQQLFNALQTALVKKSNQRKSYMYHPKDILDDLIHEQWKRVEMGGKELVRAWRNFVDVARKEGFGTHEEPLLQKVKTLCNDMEEAHNALASLLVEQEDAQQVYWAESDAEQRPDRLRLYRRPLNIREQLADDFFPTAKSIVFTSATLTVKGSFHYLLEQLGLGDEETDCLQLASPFQHEKQAQLLVPKDFPEVRADGEERFTEEATRFIAQLSPIVSGRILVLFTSYQMLKNAYRMLKPYMDALDYTLLAQGVSGDNRAKLMKQFRSLERSILLGTNTFWEGVDLPGDDVRALVIVRLPFTPPDDPVYTAKAEEIEANGGSAFSQLALPQAVLRFKQGFGRLIRTKNDRGLIFVLDKRLIKARYGKVFLRSLPEVPTFYADGHELLARAADFYERGEGE